MTDTTQFLVNHGMSIVFVAVFLEQMGLPLPVVPWTKRHEEELNSVLAA